MPTAAPPQPLHAVPRPPLRRHSAGLTLIEVMIGLVLVGILLAQAMPNSSSWVARQRLSGQAGTLGQAMAYARAEAITRGVRVTVCTSSAPTATHPACNSTGNWTDGWLVFVDNVQRAGNSAGVVDDEDTVLRVGERLTGATATADAAVRNWVAFTPDGLSTGSGGASIGSISLCLKNQARAVVFGNAGVLSSTSGSC